MQKFRLSAFCIFNSELCGKPGLALQTRQYVQFFASQASVMQIESSVRPIGGASIPAAVINLRRSSPASGCGIADCTPTRTRPSA